MKLATLAAALVAVWLAGCMGNSAQDDVAGRYATINWGSSQKSCQNGVCTYSTNQKAFNEQVRCDERTDLSWDVKNWLHGSVRVVVEDPAGDEKHRRTLSGNGQGNLTLVGARGTWHLEGQTNDANGNLQVRLTCL